MGQSVRWRGQQAEYSTDERQIMQQLTVREQAFVHTLKATMDGEIQEGHRVEVSGVLDLASPQPVSGLGLNDDSSNVAAPVLYTDPEDLEFGKPKRKRPVYALVWTWRQHKVYPTKAKATRAARAWKLWHERSGWKVVNIAGTVGYIARLDDRREAIALHEYDKDTHERLK